MVRKSLIKNEIPPRYMLKVKITPYFILTNVNLENFYNKYFTTFSIIKHFILMRFINDNSDFLTIRLQYLNK